MAARSEFPGLHLAHVVLLFVQDSGFGAFNGKEGLRAFSYQKSVVTDRIKVRATVSASATASPRTSVRRRLVCLRGSQAPPFLLYPVWPNADLIVQEVQREPTEHRAFVHQMLLSLCSVFRSQGLKMVYGRNWGVSVRALLRFLALLVKGRPKSKTA